MQVLLTRPVEDSLAMAPAIRARGWQVMIDPLLEIRYRDMAGQRLADCQGYLVTSRNGLRALLHARADKRVPVYAVGRGTAMLARENGFHSVHDADGDVDDLARMVGGLADPAGGALLHACGSNLAGNLSGALVRAGFQVQREILYRAEMATRLAGETVQALGAGDLRAVQVFSPRTATCLVGLVTAAGLSEKCRGMDALAISDKAAAPLASLPFDNIWVAGRPNQDDMLDLLQNVAPATGGIAS